MSNLVKCQVCRGTKRIVGMGMMEHECKPCKGIGWVEKVEEVEPVQIAPALILPAEEAKKCFVKLGDVPVVYKKKGPAKGWKKAKEARLAAEAKSGTGL